MPVSFHFRHIYRPQRSWAKVIFSQACVKNSVHRGGGCLPQCMLGYTPPGADTPLDQADTPTGAETPNPDQADTPPDQADPSPQTRQTPPTRQTHTHTPDPPGTRQTPPRTRQTPPPPREADSSIPSTSGRYASYWNAFLLNEMYAAYLIVCLLS